MKKLLKAAEYALFVEWVATPEPKRDPTDQGKFQQLHKVSHQTIANWKKRPHFWEDVEKKLKLWGRERTPNVIWGLYTKAYGKGDPLAVKLWLQYINRWVEKSQVDQNNEVGKNLAEIIKMDLANAKNRSKTNSDHLGSNQDES